MEMGGCALPGNPEMPIFGCGDAGAATVRDPLPLSLPAYVTVQNSENATVQRNSATVLVIMAHGAVSLDQLAGCIEAWEAQVTALKEKYPDEVFTETQRMAGLIGWIADPALSRTPGMGWPLQKSRSPVTGTSSSRVPGPVCTCGKLSGDRRRRHADRENLICDRFSPFTSV